MATEKALTIRQPWATLIVTRVKDVENRTWHTRFRGRLLIHAGVGVDHSDWNAHVPAEHHAAIIGAVTVVDCVRDAASEWAEDDSWHWILTDAVQFVRPVSVKGKLGLWTPADDVLKACDAQLRLMSVAA